MKPNIIIVVPHGESEANINKKLYEDKPDHLMGLTESGNEQCVEAGIKLKSLLDGNRSIKRDKCWGTL